MCVIHAAQIGKMRLRLYVYAQNDQMVPTVATKCSVSLEWTDLATHRGLLCTCALALLPERARSMNGH